MFVGVKVGVSVKAGVRNVAVDVNDGEWVIVDVALNVEVEVQVGV